MMLGFGILEERVLCYYNIEYGGVLEAKISRIVYGLIDGLSRGKIFVSSVTLTFLTCFLNLILSFFIFLVHFS